MESLSIRAEANHLTTTTPSASSLSAPIEVDGSPISPLGLIVLKIYAFGGLSFVVLIILSALAHWTWVVVIKREVADSPPELEIYPEVSFLRYD